MRFAQSNERVHVTRNLNLAAAFITCGVPFHVERVIDDGSGQEVCEFHLGPAPDPALSSLPPFSVGCWLHLIRQNEWDKIDPVEPFMDALESLYLRECLLDFMEKGISYRITPLLRALGRCTLRQEPEPLQSRVGHADFPLIRSHDLELSVALLRCGFPVLRIEGQKPHRRFIHARAHPFPETLPGIAVDAMHLAQRLGDGTLERDEPGHPALWALVAQRNRAGLLRHIREEQPFILIRDLRTRGWARHKRCATVRADSSRKAFDAALDFSRS